MRRFSGGLVALLALLTLLVGCGSSSSSSSSATLANKASFCGANTTLDKATASASTPAEFIKALTANQSAITEFAKTAPSAIKAQAQVLVTGALAAIKAKSVTAFNTTKFASAGQAVDTFCGEKSSGSSSATTSTTS